MCTAVIAEFRERSTRLTGATHNRTTDIAVRFAGFVVAVRVLVVATILAESDPVSAGQTGPFHGPATDIVVLAIVRFQMLLLLQATGTFDRTAAVAASVFVDHRFENTEIGAITLAVGGRTPARARQIWKVMHASELPQFFVNHRLRIAAILAPKLFEQSKLIVLRTRSGLTVVKSAKAIVDRDR